MLLLGIKQFVSCILVLTFKDCSVEYIGELTLTFTRPQTEDSCIASPETEAFVERRDFIKADSVEKKRFTSKKNLPRLRNRMNKAWLIRHYEQIRENLFLF